MNRRIARTASLVNLTAVVCFALSMLLGFDFGSYFSSMFIAFSFVPMACAFAHFSGEKAKLAGLTAVGFSAVYAAVVLLIYFAQLTTVRMDALTEQAAVLLDFQRFGLLFNYDLLGYGLMALSTFFAGLTDVYKRQPVFPIGDVHAVHDDAGDALHAVFALTTRLALNGTRE